MRQVVMSDLIGAARCLLLTPPDARADWLENLLDHAQVADKTRKRTGRNHPVWGNGSLSGATAKAPKAAERFLSDPEYLDVLTMILRRLREKYHP